MMSQEKQYQHDRILCMAEQASLEVRIEQLEKIITEHLLKKEVIELLLLAAQGK